MNNSNSVIFKIYKKNDVEDIIFEKEYIFDLNEKIIDVKNIILAQTFSNSHNYLDLENISERIYKDFGKLFFDYGIIPMINDNYRLSHFTNGNRTFSFIGNPKNIDVKKNQVPNQSASNGFLKKIIKEDKKKNGDVVFDEDDFPPLGSSLKK
jgi:hypothetical protein